MRVLVSPEARLEFEAAARYYLIAVAHQHRQPDYWGGRLPPQTSGNR